MVLRIMKLLPVIIVSLFTASVYGGPVPVANHSFENPVVAPVEPYAWPDAENWIELDNDALSRETGVFYNIFSGIANADANQLAFLSGEEGTEFLQDLSAVYQVGKAYRMTVGVCVSGYQPPDPNGLVLSFYYRDPNVVDVATEQTPPPSHFTSTALENCSVFLPTVQDGAACVGKTIGIRIRATGPLGPTGAFGTYWDMDNVRVMEYPRVPDFRDDPGVDMVDFAMMAADWLSCDEPLTDVTGEGCVNHADLMILLEYWLDG